MKRQAAATRPAPSVIDDFIASYPAPQEARKILWELLLAAMGSAHADMWTSEVRANMLFFTEQCGDVLDEMYARYQSQMSV